MKSSHFVRVALPAILLVTATLACNLPSTTSGMDVNIAATQTMRFLEIIVAETIQAGGIEEPSQPVEPPPTEAPEPEPPTPTMTATIIPTPTETQTPTPSVPMVSVSMNTNCRFGPGKVYDYLGALLVGETAEVAGRNSANTYWYIHNPDRPGGFCWLWGRYATLTGDTSQLPVLTPPPTPTPPTPTHTPITEVLDFRIYFSRVEYCPGGWDYRFRIGNSGTLPLESAHIIVKDLDIGVTKSLVINGFASSPGCFGSLIPVISPGGVGWGYTLPFGHDYDPNGHHIQATATLCTEDDLGGDCAEKTITFVP